ncbi:uncharacterized protein [Antedon mediterranea]|uniref:uncharacterized protein n=1 Tax=Antedon mediterranea TaxID=105859 RepID=UPI003AF83FD1
MSENIFKQLEVAVYFDLTKTESLRVASRHNFVTGNTHQATFEDNVAVCRNILQDYNDKDAKTTSTWRRKCAEAIGKQSFEKKIISSMEPMFQVSLYTDRCYTKVTKLFAKYNAGTVKDSKPGKQLKQSFFMTLQGLSEEDKFELLSSVTDGTMSIKEVENKARSIKQIKVIRGKFLTTIKVLTWKEATERFPEHTTDSALRPFLTTRKLSKSEIPPGLFMHCQDALFWEEQRQSQPQASTVDILTEDGTRSKCQVMSGPFIGRKLTDIANSSNMGLHRGLLVLTEKCEKEMLISDVIVVVCNDEDLLYNMTILKDNDRVMQVQYWYCEEQGIPSLLLYLQI